MDLHVAELNGTTHVVSVSEILADDCCVTDARILFSRMVGNIASWCTVTGTNMFDIYCNTFDGNDETGFDLGMVTGADFFERLYDVARLAWYIHENEDIEEARIFAVIENVHLQYFDFDSIADSIEDGYHGPFEDLESFAREHLSEIGQEIPEDLESYFDYDGYAEDLFDNFFSKIEWGGQTFAYSC